MPANTEIISHLNTILKNELTAINQYFLHARMLKHMGFMVLADHEYKHSIDAMKHADMLIERTLSLGGLPNLQELGKIYTGDTMDNILACDLTLTAHIQNDLEAAIQLCTAQKDKASLDMLQRMLKSEKEHALFTQEQLNLIASKDAVAYMQA